MIPKLRFPEFNESWHKVSISDIAEICGGGTPDTTNPEYWVREINWFTPTEIGKSKFVSNSKRKISHKGLSKSSAKLLPEGTILLSTRATIGETSITTEKSTTNQGFQNLIVGDSYDIEFVYYLLETLRKDLLRRSSGSTFLEISKKEIAKIKCLIPTHNEQEKIASFISALDQKINLLTKKKEALETYKKGLMRKIFSQEYWNQGFMILSQICKIYDGTHQTPKYVDEGVSFYSVEHVSKDDFSKTKFVTEEVFIKECQRVSIEQGDILMTRIGSVGVPKFIDWNVRASFYVSLALLKPKIEGINMGWLSYYIQSSDIQRDIWRLTIHVAFPKKINLGDIGKIRVKLPSKAVQESNYILLKSLDQKINFITKKIKASEELKKGLLQQMFV